MVYTAYTNREKTLDYCGRFFYYVRDYVIMSVQEGQGMLEFSESILPHGPGSEIKKKEV